MVSEELGTAHHMEDEEGGGEKQRLVHCLPLSHVPLLGLSHSLLCASRREEERRMMGEEVGGRGRVGGRRGGRGQQPTSPRVRFFFPPGGRLQLPVRRGDVRLLCSRTGDSALFFPSCIDLS